jgi:hypothetical protein
MLPDTVAADIIDFSDVVLKTGENATRITIDRLLTDDEKKKMKSRRFLGLDCIAVYKYAPEIKHSYFYVKGLE